MITLDYRDRRPLYEQVLEGLKDLMIRGILEQGEKLPSVRSLATDLAINPNTIQRAYAELERSGFIYSVQGRGSFVADLGAVHQERVQEWEREFDELMEEAKLLSIPKEAVVSRVEEKMKEEGRHD